MKVNFADVSYEEICVTRREALQIHTKDYMSWKYAKEKSLVILRRMLYLLTWGYFMHIYLIYCDKVITDKIFQIFNTESILGIFLVWLSITAFISIISFKIIYSMVKHLIPIKTPVMDRLTQHYKFWSESEYIENVAKIMKELQALSEEDLAYSEIQLNNEEQNKEHHIELLIKNSKWGLIEKQKYIVKNDEVLEILKNTGVLDFSSLDIDWKNIKERYSICLHVSKNTEENTET